MSPIGLSGQQQRRTLTYWKKQLISSRVSRGFGGGGKGEWYSLKPIKPDSLRHTPWDWGVQGMVLGLGVGGMVKGLGARG